MHLTLNFSNDGLVYAADRAANRVIVTKKDGAFVKNLTARPLPARCTRSLIGIRTLLRRLRRNSR